MGKVLLEARPLVPSFSQGGLIADTPHATPKLKVAGGHLRAGGLPKWGGWVLAAGGGREAIPPGGKAGSGGVRVRQVGVRRRINPDTN